MEHAESEQRLLHAIDPRLHKADRADSRRSTGLLWHAMTLADCL